MQKALARVSLLPIVVLALGCERPASEGEAPAPVDTPPTESAPGDTAVPDTAAVRTTVDSLNTVFVEAFGTRDWDGIASVYAEDARILPPGAPMRQGRDSIRGFWRDAIEQLDAKGVALEPVELTVLDRQAYEIGRYRIEGAAGPLDEGKYVVVVKRTADGSWKWTVDIWNSSGTAAETAEGP